MYEVLMSLGGNKCGVQVPVVIDYASHRVGP